MSGLVCLRYCYAFIGTPQHVLRVIQTCAWEPLRNLLDVSFTQNLQENVYYALWRGGKRADLGWWHRRNDTQKLPQVKPEFDVSHGVLVQLGIILCDSVRPRIIIEAGVRTEMKAMLAINEVSKGLNFRVLDRYRIRQESGTGEKVLGHLQGMID